MQFLLWVKWILVIATIYIIFAFIVSMAFGARIRRVKAKEDALRREHDSRQ